MKTKYLPLVALLVGCLYSCDDETPGIGNFVQENEKIAALATSFDITTHTQKMDSVYSRMATAYLGKYTDPLYGDFTADFIAQINCPENFQFPAYTQSIEDVELQLFYKSYFGDSTSVLRMRVDTLNTVIKDYGTDKSLYYTSFQPEKYYNSTGTSMAEQSYTAEDFSVPAGTRKATTYIHHISIPLGKNMADYLYTKYNQDKKNFKDANAFINNVLKGFYVHTTGGQGSILYLSSVVLNMKTKYLEKRKSTGVVDSVAYRDIKFWASKEIFTSTKFSHSSKLKTLIEDTNCTYLKTPAGLYTELTLPIEEMYAKHSTDTLNAVTLSLQRYNEVELSGAFKLATPSSILLIRKSDMYKFFEENRLPDSETSFLSSFNATTNSYNFSQLNRLISKIFAEKKKGSTDEDLNKLVAIPVNLEVKKEVDQSTRKEVERVVGVSHNMDISSAKLVGGKDKLKLSLIYTKVKK